MRKRFVFGEQKSFRDRELAKKNLWQAGNKFMAPVIMSESIKVKKDALINKVLQEQRGPKRKIEDQKEKIMLDLLKQEAER